EMRADALDDEDIRPNAAVLVLRVAQLDRVLRRRIRKLADDPLELLKHSVRAMQTENRPPATRDAKHRTGLDLADVDLDRRPERLGPRARAERRDEWHGGSGEPGHSGHRGGDRQKMPSGKAGAFSHRALLDRKGQAWHCLPECDSSSP